MKSADEKVRKVFTYYVGVFEPKKYELQKNGILALNSLDEQYFTPQNRQALEEIFKQKTIKAQNASVEYLNRIKDTHPSYFTLTEYLQNDISNSLDPKNFEDGRIAQTKDELRAQLYNAKTKDGLILFSNDDIEKIVGAENKIPEQSKIYADMKKSNIPCKSFFINQLSKEGVSESQLQPVFKVLEELETNPKLKDLSKIFFEEDSYGLYNSLFNNTVIDSSRLKNNADVVNMFLKDMSDLQPKNARYQLLNLLTQGKNDLATVQKLLDYNVVDKTKFDSAIGLLTETDFSKSLIDNNIKLLEDLIKANIINKDESKYSETISQILKKEFKKPVNLNVEAMKVIDKFKGTRLVPLGEDLINFVLETSKNGFNPELSKGFVKELLEADAKNTAIPKLKLNFSARDYFASKQNWTELLTKKNFDFEKAEKLVKLVTKSDPEAVFSKLIPELILTSGEKFAQFVAKVGKYNEIAEKHEIKPLNFLECSVENFEMSEKTLLKKLEEIEKLAEAHSAYFNENKQEIFESVHGKLIRHDLSEHKKLAEFFDTLKDTKLKGLLSANMLNKIDKYSNIEGFIKDKKQLDEISKIFSCPNFDSSSLEGILQYDGDVNKLCEILNGMPDKEIKQKVRYSTVDKAFSLYSEYGKNSCLKVYDKDFKPASVQSVETLTDKSGRVVQLIKEKSKNMETVLTQLEFVDESVEKVDFGNSSKHFRTVSEVNKIKNEKGKVIRVERSEFSDVDGTLNFKTMDDKRKVKTHSNSRVEGNKKIVEKHLFNPLNSTRSEVLYTEDVAGNVKHTYKTIDKDGKVLLDEFQEIVKTDLNNYTSTRNGKKFKISHTESEISVFDCQKKSMSNLIWKNSSTQN